MGVSQILVSTAPVLMMVSSARVGHVHGKVLPVISVRVTQTDYYILLHFF